MFTILTLIAFFFSLFSSSIIATPPTKPQTIPQMSIIVSRDSSVRHGFRTIQSAVDYVPPNNRVWTTIHVKAGYYYEQVWIPKNKPFIHIKGEGKFTTFVVSKAHGPINESAAFTSEADFTLAQDISFSNAYNSHHRNKMVQAVAARIQGDKSAFLRCGFYSLQDTLWDAGGRHYFKHCTIYGAVDYIFGAGQSLYQSCTISVAALDGGVVGYITAQARGDPRETSGFVFNHCKIIGRGKAYLGRPWRDHARVLFFNTFMSEAVVPQGWDSWDKAHLVKQLSLGEYGSSGPGAERSKRVEWAKKMSEKEAKQLASTSFIDDQGWLNQAFTILGASLIH